jgi:hypothetical protein
LPRKAVPYFTQQFREARRKWALSNPVRKECFKNAELVVDGVKKWRCRQCDSTYFYAFSALQCDHIQTIGSNSPIEIFHYIQCFIRLHAPLEGLQILCKKCHKIKSKQDNMLSKQQSKAAQCFKS